MLSVLAQSPVPAGLHPDLQARLELEVQRMSGELSASERKLELLASDLAAERDRTAVQAGLLERKVSSCCNSGRHSTLTNCASIMVQPQQRCCWHILSVCTVAHCQHYCCCGCVANYTKHQERQCVVDMSCAPRSAAKSSTGRRPTTRHLTRSQRCTPSCWPSTKIWRRWRGTWISCTRSWSC
jgi:hypothetical protein